ncbi:MAG: dTMP kinase [Polyangiales bacterium]
MSGVFIVVEGVDGAGKGTQIELLRDALARKGRSVHVTAEPSTLPIGLLLRRYLRRELPDSIPGAAGMALLFAADRMQHLDHEILAHLAVGEIVVCDRYYASSIAYQAAMDPAAGPELMRWIAEINAHARRPDRTLVLDLDPEVAASRRAARGTPGELFEHLEIQRRIRDNYRKLAALHPEDAMEFVDASRTPDLVHADILARLAL